MFYVPHPRVSPSSGALGGPDPLGSPRNLSPTPALEISLIPGKVEGGEYQWSSLTTPLPKPEGFFTFSALGSWGVWGEGHD